VNVVIGFIGLGEAGTVIAKGLRESGAPRVLAYDVALENDEARVALERRAADAGVELRANLQSLVEESDTVISAVVCSEAVAAAEAAAPHLRADHLYVDLNSVSPDTKRHIAAVVTDAGARFVEAAVMANVPRLGHGVPMLLCGEAVADVIETLAPLGMALEDFGREIGRASAVKMFRSLVVKGLEALFLECVLASSRYGVAKEVLDYVTVGYPGLDWNQLADNLLTRTALHGTRRAHELGEVADTLAGMGIDPLMARAGSERLMRAARLGLDAQFRETPPAGYADVVRAIESKNTG
jgi:3-hydroxyisobutyrate dehydrogenase-like beta-hydroxyacid dehydrogenase